MDIPLHAAFRDLRLVEYLGILWPDRSLEALRDLFACGRLRSGGRPVGARRRVGEVAELTLHGTLDDVPAIFSSSRAGEEAQVRILHEDDRLIALSKPGGVAVVPDRDKAVESCLGFLIRRELAARGSKAPAEFIRYRVVHRIDRLTSGLVIMAKTPEIERRLGADFENRRVKKEYIALLAGVVEPARITVNCPIAPGRKGRMRAEIRPGEAKKAMTHFDVVERFRDTTLVRALPVTGRTHQIRVHAWAMRHPLAVDPLYGNESPAAAREALKEFPQLTLHARRYTLPAEWDEPRSFECPLPPHFAARLRDSQK